MAYNIDLEDHIDRLAPCVGDPEKKKMFGGIGYMLNVCRQAFALTKRKNILLTYSIL